MRRPRSQLTVFRLLLVVAVAAILFHLATAPLRDRNQAHYERCMEIADTHARLAAEYRRNGRGDATMIRIATWHQHMRRGFEQAAERPEMPLPSDLPFPPERWVPGDPGGE